MSHGRLFLNFFVCRVLPRDEYVQSQSTIWCASFTVAICPNGMELCNYVKAVLRGFMPAVKPLDSLVLRENLIMLIRYYEVAASLIRLTFAKFHDVTRI